MSATYVPGLLSDLGGTITTASISGFAESSVDDRVAALLVEGSGIDLTYDDGAGTLTIAATGGGGGASPPFAGGAANPLVKDATDATKLAAFSAASIATATTRTYTLPDASLVLAGSAAALTSGRVPYAAAGGLLVDSANLTFSGSNLAAASGKVTASNGTYTAQIGGDNGFGAFVGASANSGSGLSFTHAADILPLVVSSGALGLVGNTIGLGRAAFRFSAVYSNIGDFQPVTASDVPAVVSGAASQTANIQEWRSSAAAVHGTVSENGYFTTRKTSAPADAELAAGEAAWWFDSTNGAAKLMVKAKQANGTVVTGNITLA